MKYLKRKKKKEKKQEFDNFFQMVLCLPERSAKLIVVHVWFCFAFAPSSGHLVRIVQFEFSIYSFPHNEISIRRISEQLQQKLPQLYLARPLRHQSMWSCVQQLIWICGFFSVRLFVLFRFGGEKWNIEKKIIRYKRNFRIKSGFLMLNAYRLFVERISFFKPLAFWLFRFIIAFMAEYLERKQSNTTFKDVNKIQ